MTYKVSKDYKRLKKLLDEDNKIVCFVDYDWGSEGNTVTDIACANRKGCGEYSVYWRGVLYMSVNPSLYSDFSDDKLYKEFARYNVQFIDPDYERNTLELEYKR